MKPTVIREIKQTELTILEKLLYEAIFQLPENGSLPFEYIYRPEIYVYIDRFGTLPDDHCLIAEVDGKIAGGVWIRILDNEVKGFGNIDSETPEFGISLFPEYRNQGIGTLLMRTMLDYMKEKGYAKASLSVDKNNYAVKLYLSSGFHILKENEHDYVMVYELI